MRLADCLGAALGQADVLEEALVAQLDERLHDLLDRTRLVHASALEDGDLGGRETLGRVLDLAAQELLRGVRRMLGDCSA